MFISSQLGSNRWSHVRAKREPTLAYFFPERIVLNLNLGMAIFYLLPPAK